MRVPRAAKGAIEWTWHCDHEVDILGVAAKGKRTMMRGISYVALQSGKIVAERDYWVRRPCSDSSAH